MVGMWSSNNNYSDDFSDNTDFTKGEEVAFTYSPSRLQEEEGGYNSSNIEETEFDSPESICFNSGIDTDNAESSSVILQSSVSLNEVLAIEEQLDAYEKVSLVYLIEDNLKVALKELTQLINGHSTKLLYNWAKAQNLMRKKWQEKLIEALTIIQNYEVLGKLGFKRKNLEVKFLPRSPFTSEYVNRVRKTLYLVCDNLVPTDVENLLKFVADDFTKNGWPMKKFHCSYLEMYFLHWEKIGYIKHDNLDHFYSILRQLDFFDLKLGVPVFQEQVLHDKYEIDPNNPGTCLIINQEHFYTEVNPQYKELLLQNKKPFDSRLGTEKDRQELESTFKMFGFKTECVNNLTHSAILEKIREFIEGVTTESSLFICIMSHGLEDDSEYTDDEKFVSKNSPSRIQEEEDGYNYTKGEEVLDSLNSICFDSATDAINAQSSSAITHVTVSLNQVLTIEEQLDTYEKVSLVYLLEDSPEVALEELGKLINGQSPKILHNWAKAQNEKRQKWHEKFVEAITIIQNYNVLGKLGFKRKDLDVRFLPKQSFTSEYVNRVRKALYYVCENLLPTDVGNLLKFVAVDFARKGLAVRIFDSSYLEMYFLHWERVGYLKHDNLNNLCNILKQAEFFDLCDHLKLAVPVFQEQVVNNQNDEMVKSKTSDSGIKNEKKKSLDIFGEILGESTLMEFVSGDSFLGTDNTPPAIIDPNTYEIDPKNPGVCLIINQENFYTEVNPKYKHLLPQNGIKLDPRQGTEKDRQELESTFNIFGFKTEVVNDLKHTAISKKIDEFIENVTTESSLFICIMSHGHEGVVYGVNSCQVTVKSIQNLMCTKNRNNLKGKPKVLILQSCQGTRCQQLSYKEQEELMAIDGPSTSKQEAIPPSADLFTFWATVPGYSAIRHKRDGTWFIQSLCEKMKALGNTSHFEDICTAVIDDVTSKKWSQDTGVLGMVPLKDSTLRKKFFLPPIKC